MNILLFLGAVAPSALPPQPATRPAAPKWIVNYSPDSCEVLRPRVDGKVGMMLRMRPHSAFYEFKFLDAPNGCKPSAEVIALSVSAVGSAYPQIATFGDTPDGKHGIVETIVSSDQLAKAISDGSVTARGKGMGEKTVSTAGLSKAMAAADRCVTDLAVRWNAPRTWASDPKAVADPRSVFRADDYPSTMRDLGRSGTVRALLGIGPDGRVASCRPVEVVGDTMFGEVTCDILRKRAQFLPATDAAGQKVTSFALAPPVHWRLSW